MRNNPIERTNLGSSSPFDLLKGDQQNNDNTLELDKIDGPTPLPTPKPLGEKTPPVPPKIGGENGQEGGDEGDEEEDELPSNAKVKIKTNVTKLLAERLKTDGQLPEDFEIDEKTTSKDVETAYRKFMADKVREEERNAAIEELKSDGYDDKVLKSAQKLHYGVPERDIEIEEIYSTLGTIEFDSSHDSYEKNTKMLFQQYYLDKGLPNEEAQRNAIRDYEDSEDIPSLISNRQTYFSDRAAQMDEAQKEHVKNAKIADNTQRTEKLTKIQTLLDGGVIDGVQYSKQDMELVRKAFFEKNEVIVDEQGKRIRVTGYFKKKYERAKNEEQSLKDIVDFVLGYDVKKITDKAKRTVRKNIVDELNDLIEVDVELTPSKSSQRNDNSGGDIMRKSLG